MRRTVKELLVEIKDTSELMIDLAYSAILFDNEDIAEEVLNLERKMIEYLRDIRIVSILSARRVDEAESVSTILQIANAVQKMGNAAGDIAMLVIKDYKLPKEMVKSIMIHSEETVTKAEVSRNSEVAGKPLGVSKIHTRTGMRVIAIRRGVEWIYDPDRDTRILKGDVLFARGDSSGIPKFMELVTCERRDVEKEPPEKEITDLDKAVNSIIQMKNLSELAVDLSYLSILYDNEEIAHEVIYIENEVDNMKHDLQHWVLMSTKEFNADIDPLVALLELSYTSEVIADSAREIAETVLGGMEVHPIFQEAMKETDEVISIVEVDKNSNLNGKTLGEARVETNTGMHVIAIKRGNSWITRPSAYTKMFAGDLLIAKGTREGRELLNTIAISTS
ncbi:MAG TPA: potassium channel family protein [Archaeoglobaceae archaeon]|nr:potassium channel family protein [Archaeoglobaceae archaeon]